MWCEPVCFLKESKSRQRAKSPKGQAQREETNVSRSLLYCLAFGCTQTSKPNKQVFQRRKSRRRFYLRRIFWMCQEGVIKHGKLQESSSSVNLELLGVGTRRGSKVWPSAKTVRCYFYVDEMVRNTPSSPLLKLDHTRPPYKRDFSRSPGINRSTGPTCFKYGSARYLSGPASLKKGKFVEISGEKKNWKTHIPPTWSTKWGLQNNLSQVRTQKKHKFWLVHIYKRQTKITLDISNWGKRWNFWLDIFDVRKWKASSKSPHRKTGAQKNQHNRK